MKQLLILFIAYLVMIKLSFAQNIGIGTVLPGAKLQINHRTTASSPTLRLFDSTAGTGSSILFAKESQTNTFSIISTNSTFAADNTLDFRTTFNSGFLLRGNGRVGINNITNPAATLHVGGGVKINDTLNVSGDLNISSELKVNGDPGLPGQALMKNNAGQLSWQFSEEFKNIQSFTNLVPTTWTVPAYVTRIKVELWGGGGGGGTFKSGSSGAYVMALLNVTPGDVWNIQIGHGGGGNDPHGTAGDTSSFKRGSISINAAGGRSSDFLSTSGFIVSGITSFVGFNGNSGRLGKYSYEQSGSTTFIFVQDADGADAPFIPHSGGSSGWRRSLSDGSAIAGSQGGMGARPGGGGGLFLGQGGDGMVVISW